jgi:hypothetical protein
VIVRNLLKRALEDPRLLITIEQTFPLLAEAAPNFFLDAVAAGLEGRDPVLMKLFSEETDGLFGARSHHTGLLWALETVAWSPEHLRRSALNLARLARLDPGGRISNRPENSLRDIFLPLWPQTGASIALRDRVLRAIVAREPDVGWKLLIGLLPDSRGVMFPNAKPKWREWVPDRESTQTWGEIWGATATITTHLLGLVGTSGARWELLIKQVDHLPEKAHTDVVERLETARVKDFAPADRLLIWNAVRDLVTKHEQFPDAEWVLPLIHLARLKRVLSRWEPKDPIDKYEWLFSDFPTLMRSPETDWKKNIQKVEDARVRAVRSIYRRHGLAGIREMLSRIDRTLHLGHAVGANGVLAKNGEDDLLRSYLDASDAKEVEFLRAFLRHRFNVEGWTWVDSKTWALPLKPSEHVQFFVSLPPSQEVWDRVSRAGSEVEALYWKNVTHVFGIDELNDIILAVQGLLTHKRPYTAIDAIVMFSHHNTGFPPSLMVEALEQAAYTSPAEDSSHFPSFSYHVGELLNQIEASGAVPEERIAQLEWQYLPLFRHGARKRPKALHRALGRDPEFFAEVVSLAYKAAGDEAEPSLTEVESTRALLAHELIESWHSVPGRSGDGTLDGDVLKDWVHKARDAVLARKRGVGDSLIGHLLRYAPGDSDGTWPATPVRELIEDLECDALEHGLEIEVFNSRGATSRGLTDGGRQEYALVEHYREQAKKVADEWPRTAAMLLRLAATYERHARREDTSAELTEDLWT